MVMEGEENYRYTGDDEDDEALANEIAQAAAAFNDGDVEYVGFEDEEEGESSFEGIVDQDEFGDVIQLQWSGGNVVQTRELQRIDARADGALAVELRSGLAAEGVETENTIGLLALPVAVEMQHHMEAGPTGTGNTVNMGGQVFMGPSDAIIRVCGQVPSRDAEGCPHGHRSLARALHGRVHGLQHSNLLPRATALALREAPLRRAARRPAEGLQAQHQSVSVNFDAAELKRCKIAFDPDRFHVCEDGKRGAFRAMPEEVFNVVGREAEEGTGGAVG